jgi:hypothetical protein
MVQVLGSAVYLVTIALFHAFLRPKPPLASALGVDYSSCGEGSCDGSPSLGRVVGEVAAGLIGYDLLMTPVHWALHATDLQRAHAKRAAATRAAAVANQKKDACQDQDARAAAIGGAVGARCVPAWASSLATSRGLALATNPAALALTRPGLSRAVAVAFGGQVAAAAAAGSATGSGTMAAATGTAASAPTNTASSPLVTVLGAALAAGEAAVLGVLGVLGAARRSVGHGTHHEMRGALQAGATVHHALPDAALQVRAPDAAQENAVNAMVVRALRPVLSTVGARAFKKY